MPSSSVCIGRVLPSSESAKWPISATNVSTGSSSKVSVSPDRSW